MSPPGGETEAQAVLKEVRDLKKRFDALKEEFRKVHAKWKKIHPDGVEPQDQAHRERHDELLNRETEILEKIERVVDWTDKLMRNKKE